VVEAARISHANGAKIVSLSDFAISPLSKTSDINLYTTPRNAAQFMDIEMPLIVGQIGIIDILFACCLKRLGKPSLDAFRSTKDIADSEKIS
jgi:DNA-binding MurR/RpiR family transcriptional regulator